MFMCFFSFLTKRLSVPKNRNRRKIAAFSNRKVLNRRFCRRNRRKIRQKIAEEIAEKSLAMFWAAEKKSQRFRVFKSQRFRDALDKEKQRVFEEFSPLPTHPQPPSNMQNSNFTGVSLSWMEILWAHFARPPTYIPFPWSSFPCLFGKQQGKPPKRQGFLLLAEPLNPWERREKRSKSQGIPWKRKRQGKPKRQGKED